MSGVPIAIAGSGCVLASGWGVDAFWSAVLRVAQRDQAAALVAVSQ